MMLQYFDDIVTALEQRIAEPGGATPRRRYTLELARLGRRLYDGEHPVAWCGVVAPFDLLNALGVTSCFVEFVGASLSASGLVESFLDRAEQDGLGPDTCAYHRAVIGAALCDAMPVPEFLVGTTCPCTAGQATIENLARIMGRDLSMLHVPQQMTPEAEAYLVEQLRAMIAFAEARVGRALDPERLARAVELSNHSAELMQEVFDLAAHVPSPTTSRELKDFGIAMPLLFGREDTVEVIRAFRDAFRERIEASKSGLSEQRVRLLWIQNRIQFREPLVRMLEEELGATIVVDELNNITWDPVDPRDPLPGIARRMIGNSFNGPIERRIGRMQELARRYRIHGAVNPCHWGCRQGAGARGLMQEGLQRAGVPVVNLEVDCVDPRPFSEGQLRTRLEAFVEMLESRPSPWG
jgi:benzoyl-CoA reductase/2-hydroxyglutaryl-CoA dehydratase subunit BcrC/BadD/HgdB